MIVERPLLLIVDDSKNDELLLRAAFERAGYTHPVRFATNGDDAIAYLQGDGRYRDRTSFPLPTVVLMDLNMPRRNGFEVLAWIRGHPALKRLHVYILSASSRPEDIDLAYDLGANSYLVKPSNLDGLVQVAQRLGLWLKLSHFAPVKPLDPAPARTSAHCDTIVDVPSVFAAQNSSRPLA